MRLDDGKIWFVRRDDGRGIYPVSQEGWIVAVAILVGFIMSGVAALVIKEAVPEIPWLWIAVFVVICVSDAMAFFIIARTKTDPDITVSEYRARQTGRV